MRTWVGSIEAVWKTPGIVAHTCNPNSGEVEADRSLGSVASKLRFFNEIRGDEGSWIIFYKVGSSWGQYPELSSDLHALTRTPEMIRWMQERGKGAELCELKSWSAHWKEGGSTTWDRKKSWRRNNLGMEKLRHSLLSVLNLSCLLDM